MSKFYRDSLKFPVKEFDLLKEGFMGFAVVTIGVLAVAAIWKAPYRPAVTNQQIATSQPLVVMQTALGDLDGTGAIASYGPPFNHGWKGNATSVQSILGFSPQTWWGTPYHINTANADVITPLTMLGKAGNNSTLLNAVQTYQKASYSQQQAWDNNLANALNKATVSNGNVVVASGNYGPVLTMMQDEVSLAKSGLLSGALNRETNQGVYRFNVQNDLLFLQGTALHNIANSIDMSGEQWGINHDEVAMPGPWWLTPYTFFYQIPPWNTSASGDQMAAYTVAILFMLLIFLPFIPGLNRLPKLLPLHRVIWRDWYRLMEKNKACVDCPIKADCKKEFRRSRLSLKPGMALNCYTVAAKG